MPTTYNGIGTHYYGKRNLESRKGACPFCGRETTLISYNTRLWFVVIFVPLIPLGQKRIIDYCSACTRHYAVDLKQWETAKQLEISAALDKYRTTPTHENAIAVHQQLHKFHQTADADEFQKELIAKFGNQPTVQCYLGAALEHRGLQAQAEECYGKALALRPDLPQARAGVAMKAIREGRLAEAAKLLDFLDKPGAAQLYSLEPLELLGNAMQKSGDHENALRMYQRLLQELPLAGQHKAFRKKVKESEKALRRTSSILPKSKFSWNRFLGREGNSSAPSGPVLTKRGLLIAGGVAAVIAVLMALGNVHIRTHRKVYFVNGLRDVEHMVIDGEKKITLRPNRWQDQVLAEGAHTVAVTGAVQKTVHFEVKALSYFSRWFDNPVWIVNPDASACLLYQEATYSSNPQPPREQFLFGRESYYLPEVSHPFASLPESVKVESGSHQKTLQHVEVETQPIQAFYYLRENKQMADALRLAETRLRAVPGDEELLQVYLQGLKSEQDVEQGRKLLESGLAIRPVQIEWHRAYQDLSKHERRAEVVALYDSLLQKDSTNSALLYLRGRIEDEGAKAREFYNKAIAVDPQNAFAYYALAHKFWASGDWQQAKPFLARAVAIRPEDESFWKLYNLSRIGTGDTESLRKDVRDRLAKDPFDVLSAVQLLDLFAAQSRSADAESLIATFMTTARKREPRNAAAIESYLRGHFLYAFGRFGELEKFSANDQSRVGRDYLWHSLLAQGKIAEAEKVHPLDGAVPPDPLQLLSFSLASRLAGDAAKGKQSFDLAVKGFQNSLSSFKATGDLLTSGQAPTDAQLVALNLPPQNKALVAAVLRYQYPAESARFNQFARRLNLDRAFPYHLIQKSVAAE